MLHKFILKYPTSIIFLLICYNSIAQEYYIPLNIQQAYKNNTRSIDGKPGENYWQNSANYTIQAELDTKDDLLSGKAEITYFNNSPDTLHTLVFRLYQDFFREGNARQWPIPVEDLIDGVQITELKIGEENYDPEKDFPGWWMTNLSIWLKEPIVPKASEKIFIEWNFSIPTQRGLRMRKYDEGHHFIAYWYPQIAVYDDIDGWDRIEYLGSVEFYNDFNNYDVNITLPGDYIVWATGDLQNEKSIFQSDIIEKINSAKTFDGITKIVNVSDLNRGEVLIKEKKHTWQYKANKVPDFSFAISNKSHWDGTSLIVDSISGRRVLTDVVYPDDSDNWERGAEISRASVEYLSFNLPGIPFPYSHVTSFCNGTRRGGMETPMMANNGIPSRFSGFVGLLFHEISHNYFPFYMGTNERKYAWMDEGWAALLPADIVDQYNPEYNYLKGQANNYLSLAGDEIELPLMVPTFQHNSWTSGRVAAYSRPAMAYHFLRDALGDALFKKALHEFMNRWQGKHPIPHDFFNTFEDVTAEDLSWFFRPWFFEFGYPDLSIKEVNNNNEVVIEKVGKYPVTVVVTYFTKDKFTETVTVSTSVWKAKQQYIRINLPEDIIIEKVILGNDQIPDVNMENNIWENSN